MTEDKFILMDLEEAGKLGDVLKNKTSKKILNFLSDVNEVSEKDISTGLNIPLNTVEYNLKKLIKSGLVEKTNNFFWSVKGKKIPMYKLAKKNIIIGYKKPSLNYLKSILPVALVTGLAGLIGRFFSNLSYAKASNEIKTDLVSLRGAEVLNYEGMQTSVSLADKILYSYWGWFLIGALIGIFGWFIHRFFKKLKGGKNGQIN